VNPIYRVSLAQYFPLGKSNLCLSRPPEGLHLTIRVTGGKGYQKISRKRITSKRFNLKKVHALAVGLTRWLCLIRVSFK